MSKHSFGTFAESQNRNNDEVTPMATTQISYLIYKEKNQHEDKREKGIAKTIIQLQNQLRVVLVQNQQTNKQHVSNIIKIS